MSRFCCQCGCEVAEGNAFCTNCGLSQIPADDGSNKNKRPSFNASVTYINQSDCVSNSLAPKTIPKVSRNKKKTIYIVAIAALLIAAFFWAGGVFDPAEPQIYNLMVTLGALGLLGLPVFLILSIIKAIKKKPKRTMLALMALCFSVMIICLSISESFLSAEQKVALQAQREEDETRRLEEKAAQERLEAEAEAEQDRLEAEEQAKQERLEAEEKAEKERLAAEQEKEDMIKLVKNTQLIYASELYDSLNGRSTYGAIFDDVSYFTVRKWTCKELDVDEKGKYGVFFQGIWKCAGELKTVSCSWLVSQNGVIPATISIQDEYDSEKDEDIADFSDLIRKVETAIAAIAVVNYGS